MKISQLLINPVISMEYSLRMRSKRTPWVLGLYLLTLGGIIFFFLYTQMGNLGYFNPSRSRELFIMLSFMQFVMISFITPGLTAGVISGEREKQTLNILLTTNLSPSKIIIGKWLSSLSFMMLLIVTSMPLYSIVFLYGGISPLQLIKVFGIYFITMFSIGSLGVLFSTLIKRTGISTIVTYATIIAFTVLTVLIPEIIRNFLRQGGASYQVRNSWVDFFYSINPYTGMSGIFAFNSNQNLAFEPYLTFIIFFSIVTIISLMLAIFFIKPVKKTGFLPSLKRR